MVYCSTFDEEVEDWRLEENKSDFIFCLSIDRSFASKMDSLIKNLNERRGNQGLKNPDIFKTIAKHLIFAVSSIELPVKGSIINKMRTLREEAGSYENILLWLFLNPAQQAIMNCEALEKVILTGTYSVGKTTILAGRALKLNDKGEKVLFVNATGTREQEIVKTLMSLKLEERKHLLRMLSFIHPLQHLVKTFWNNGVCYLLIIPTRLIGVFKVPILPTFELETGRKRSFKSTMKHFFWFLDSVTMSIPMN